MKTLITLLLRHSLTAIGFALLVKKGIASNDEVQQAVGCVITLLGLGWSWYKNSKQSQLTAAVKDYHAGDSAALDELASRFKSPAPTKGGSQGLLILLCLFSVGLHGQCQTFISSVKPRALQYAPQQFDRAGNPLPAVPGYSPIASDAIATNAPSIQNDLRDILDHVVNSTSNLYFTPYLSYCTDNQRFGGGLGIFYPATEHLVTGVRVEYSDQTVRGVSGSAALQLPLRLAGVSVTPFAYAAIGYGLSGKAFYGVTVPGRPDDTISAVTGYGLSTQFYQSQHWTIGLVADYETWHAYGTRQLNVGPLFNYRW